LIKLDKYPINKDRLKKLETVVDSVYRPQVEKISDNKFIHNPINYFPFCSFITATENMGLYSLCIDGDIKAAKNWFYISELCSIRRYAEYEKGAASFVMGQLPTGLRYQLSDAKHLHPIFTEFRYPDEEYLEKKSSWTFYKLIRLYQETLAQDWDQVNRILEEIRSRKKLKMEPWLQHRIFYYEAMCSQDSNKIEEALSVILSKDNTKKSNYHSKDLSMGSFMCYPGMWLSKLAWFCGHEIEIEHPMIISELLPLAPLEKYTNPYSFLVDPVLDNKKIHIYGGKMSSSEVEKNNQSMYRKNSSLLQRTLFSIRGNKH
jgi:hypothetical protein